MFTDQKPVQILQQLLSDDGIYPNNSRLPVLVYQHAVALPEADPAVVFETVFAAHHWGGSWRNGVYAFHHYHSTAHEVLGVYRGTVRVRFGGEHGISLTAQPGDVILIPAGVAHKNLEASRDLGIVGAYPAGQAPDLCSGQPGERPQADAHIARVALPQTDPVYGAQGVLFQYWSAY